MAAPLTELRGRLKAILEAEFAVDGITVYDGKLHQAVIGPAIAVFPEAERPLGRAELVNEVLLNVQVFGPFDKSVDVERVVDPSWIEEQTWRIQRAIENDAGAGSARLWYYTVTGITYPDDPVGQKSRAVVTIRGFGNNASLVETAA